MPTHPGQQCCKPSYSPHPGLPRFPSTNPQATQCVSLSSSHPGLAGCLDTRGPAHLICDQIPSRELRRAPEGHSNRSAWGGRTGRALIGVRRSLGALLSLLLLWAPTHLAGSWGRRPRAYLPLKLMPLREGQPPSLQEPGFSQHTPRNSQPGHVAYRNPGSTFHFTQPVPSLRHVSPVLAGDRYQVCISISPHLLLQKHCGPLFLSTAFDR